MKIAVIAIFLFVSFAANAQRDVPVMKFSDLENRLFMNDGNTWVINFWATWCAPCVKEMPYFEKIGEEFSEKNVKVLLVSLDFIGHLENRVLPFLQEYNIASEVILLNDPRANAWIPIVSDEWSGALPATLIYNKNYRRFYEKTFTYSELQSAVEEALITIK